MIEADALTFAKGIVMAVQWTKRKVMLVSVLLLGAAASISYGVYQSWLKTPPPMPMTAETALTTIDTPQFKQMPSYRQREYYAQANRLISALSVEERKALFERLKTDETMQKNMGEMKREAMVQRALEFASATPESRNQLLDQSIDEMQAMRKEFSKFTAGGSEKPGDGKSPGGPGGRKMDPSKMKAQMQDNIQHGNPQQGNLMAEYFRALQARMNQRGIKPPGP